MCFQGRKTYIDRGVAVRGKLLKHRDRHGEKLPIADIVYRGGLEGRDGGGLEGCYERRKERWSNWGGVVGPKRFRGNGAGGRRTSFVVCKDVPEATPSHGWALSASNRRVQLVAFNGTLRSLVDLSMCALS